MITEEEYNTRIQTLLDSGIDPRIAPTQAVLDYGLEKQTITKTDADMALNTFQMFLNFHPEHVFLSPRERCEKGYYRGPEESDFWDTIQPILDKAQGF